jgi:hypothetical protein
MALNETTTLPKGKTMQNIKPKLKSAVNHVYSHRARYATATTLLVCYAVSTARRDEWNRFLDDNGLMMKYYTPEALDE